MAFLFTINSLFVIVIVGSTSLLRINHLRMAPHSLLNGAF